MASRSLWRRSFLGLRSALVSTRGAQWSAGAQWRAAEGSRTQWRAVALVGSGIALAAASAQAQIAAELQENIALEKVENVAENAAVEKVEEEAQVEEDEIEEEEEEKTERRKWDYVPMKKDYLAVFLDEESRKKLRERFPPLYSEEHYDHLTIVYEPSREDVLEQDDLITEEYTLHIIGYAEDEHCQSLLVEAEHPHLASRNKYGHITLTVQGGEQYAAKYSNTLFYRLSDVKEAKRCFRLLDNRPDQPTSWMGTLSEAGTFASSKAKFENVELEQLIVSGTYCLASEWDGQKCSYVRENECSFCKFMKGGPCRKEFSSWEQCVSAARGEEGENEFIDRCASHTLILKNCVDEHPEYYSLLSDSDEDKKTGLEEDEDLGSPVETGDSSTSNDEKPTIDSESESSPEPKDK